MARLDGKIALVFGAGSIGPGWSNGRAAAVAYAREGAVVLATDVDEASVAETCRLIRDEGGSADFLLGDVADSASVRETVAACVARHGRIDILHNNVGISAMGGPEDIDETIWDRVISVNLKGMFLTCRHALPVMRAAPGPGARNPCGRAWRSGRP